MRRAKIAVSILIALLGIASAHSQTNVGGNILTDTTWTAEDSPYVLINSVIVGNGATLTIEAGVEVRVGLKLSIATGTPSFGAGAIIARGTESEPVLVTSNPPEGVSGNWDFLLFADNTIDANFDPVTGDYLSGSMLRHTVIEFAGGGPEDTGAVTINQANVFLDHTTIRDSARHGVCADLSNTSHGIRMHGCEFLRCIAEEQIRGAGAKIYGGRKHSIVDCSFTECVGSAYNSRAGGLWLEQADDTVLSGLTFDSCSATGFGGAVYVTFSDYLVIHDVTVRNCSSEYYGGMYFSGNDSTLSNMVFENNSCTTSVGDVGGLNCTGERITIRDSVFTSNTAGSNSGESGAMNCSLYASLIENCSFINNSAGAGAGAIQLGGSLNIIRDCSFEGNTNTSMITSVGGGAMIMRGSHQTVERCTFINNRAMSKAGAILVNRESDFSDIQHCVFENNRAPTYGGGVCIEADDFAVKTSYFNGNHGSIGGGIYIADFVDRLDIRGSEETGQFNEFGTNTGARGNAIYNARPYESDGSGDVDASANCWNTNDPQGIADQIYDFYDDAMLGVVVIDNVAPCSCLADVNADGILSPPDFVAWIAAYYNNSFFADQNQDGSIEPNDFTAWMNNYNIGCE